MSQHRTFIGLGVRWEGICGELRRKLGQLELERDAGFLVVSALDGEHSHCGSLHYQGQAVDVRGYMLRHLGTTGQVIPIEDEWLRLRCPPPHWDLIRYPWGWHIEWDPKGKK